MSTFGDEYSISNYTKKGIGEVVISNDNNIDYSKLSYSDLDIAAAIVWSNESLRTIVTPKNTLIELEELWIEFNSIPLKLRRESDWKSIELFGITNQRHYEFLKSKLLRIEMSDRYHSNSQVVREAVESSNDSVDFSKLSYNQVQVDDAIAWSKENMRVIIVPTTTLDELEELWTNFNLMVIKHRRESDWKSEELFGITNLRHYEFLKTRFLHYDWAAASGEVDIDFDNISSTSIIHTATDRFIKKYNTHVRYCDDPIMESVSNLINGYYSSESTYISNVFNSVIKETAKTLEEDYLNIDSSFIPYADLPYYTPEEMLDLGVFSPSISDNFYGVSADNDTIAPTITSEQWFNSYRWNFIGYDTAARKEMADLRLSKLYMLIKDLKKLKTENATDCIINAKKQSILELGWNPEVPFTDINRIKARNRISSIISENTIKTDIIDLRGAIPGIHEDPIISESLKETLHPIYIVLVGGISQFSQLIKGVTNSIYSHAGIAFDSSLEQINSFGIAAHQKIRGGFVVENIKKYPSNGPLAVFTLFVKKDIIDKVKEIIQWFTDHAAETSYSYKNILTYLFRIPHNESKNFICSQFVDRMLKMVNVDITNKDSSLVSPADFQNLYKGNGKIYSLFEGLVKEYDAIQMKRVVSSIRKKAEPIVEGYSFEQFYQFALSEGTMSIPAIQHYSGAPDANDNIRNIYEKFIVPTSYAQVYAEAKEFPVQFDTDGNLLIRNLKKLDFGAEYATSHKLLIEYEKANNTEGMKYELSKLWMMNNIIEKYIRKDSDNIDLIKELYNHRAHILNDFKKYLAIVHQKDNTFNFTEYYDNSPFSSAVTKINGPTIKYTIQAIKDILKFL